jgi:SAM-dependent methyltransferase
MVRLAKLRHFGVKVRSKVARLAKPGSLPGFPFQCNICGSFTASPIDTVSDREIISCHICKSNLRFRSLIAALTDHIYGKRTVLAAAESRRDIVGIGLSDSPVYSEWLSEKFSYRNTYLHTKPVLDILAPDHSYFGMNDFVISSDVFEHVKAPVSVAFSNAFKLLRPGGVLVLTVPYKREGATEEHYPNLHDYHFVRDEAGTKIVNVTRQGQTEVFDDPVFHGGDGLTLEMRLFSLPSLLGELNRAGFKDVRVHDTPIPEFGILCQGQPSLPISAKA